MDVVTHHTTVADDFAMTRSQWLITGVDKNGKTIEVHHHGMEVHRRLPDGTWVFFYGSPVRSQIRTGPWTVPRKRNERPAEPTAVGRSFARASRFNSPAAAMSMCSLIASMSKSVRCQVGTPISIEGAAAKKRRIGADGALDHRPGLRHETAEIVLATATIGKCNAEPILTQRTLPRGP